MVYLSRNSNWSIPSSNSSRFARSQFAHKSGSANPCPGSPRAIPPRIKVPTPDWSNCVMSDSWELSNAEYGNWNASKTPISTKWVTVGNTSETPMNLVLPSRFKSKSAWTASSLDSGGGLPWNWSMSRYSVFRRFKLSSTPLRIFSLV